MLYAALQRCSPKCEYLQCFSSCCHPNICVNDWVCSRRSFWAGKASATSGSSQGGDRHFAVRAGGGSNPSGVVFFFSKILSLKLQCIQVKYQVSWCFLHHAMTKTEYFLQQKAAAFLQLNEGLLATSTFGGAGAGESLCCAQVLPKVGDWNATVSPLKGLRRTALTSYFWTK